MEADFSRDETRQFPARMSSISEATAFLVELVRQSHGTRLDETTYFDLRLAVTESLANIVEHSYGNEPDHTVRMNVRVREGRVEILFTDLGRRPDPSRLKSRNLGEYRERGLGLFLISKCMDMLHYSFGRDGVNTLRMYRELSPGSRRQPRESHHRSFHAATFEHEDGGRTVCLFGSFDALRPDPLPAGVDASGARVVLDLSLLDAIDFPGAQSVHEFIRREKEAGANVELIPPSASVCGTIRRIIPDFFWTCVAPAAGEADRAGSPLNALGAPSVSGISRTRTVEARHEGRLIPLFRSRRPSDPMIPADREEVRNALCKRFLTRGRISVDAAVVWGTSGGSYFASLMEDPEYEDGLLIFLGCSTLQGWEAVQASSRLHAALSCWPDLRKEDATLHSIEAFVARLSSVMRDLLPHASAASESGLLHAAAIRITPERVRVLSGTGIVLASVGSLHLRSVPIGASESFPSETFDLDPRLAHAEAPGADLRILLGRVGAEKDGSWTNLPFATIQARLAAEREPAADKGVLDVRILPA